MSRKFSGHKIRVLRKELGMSIKELAEAANLSTGLISQIERDLVSPSVNAMLCIRPWVNFLKICLRTSGLLFIAAGSIK